MIDVSKLTVDSSFTMIILVILVFLAFINIVVGISKGLSRSFFFGYIALLIFGFIKIVPMLFEAIDNAGFIPDKLPIITHSNAINIISYLAVFLGWLLVKAIIKKLLRKIGEHIKVVDKISGFLFGVVLSVVVAFASCKICTSNYVFYGSSKIKEQTKLAVLIEDKVVYPTDKFLKEKGMEISIENLLIKKTTGDNEELFEEYKQSFKKIDKLIENPSIYFITYVGFEENVDDSVQDLCNVLNCVSKYNIKSLHKSVFKTADTFLDLYTGLDFSTSLKDKLYINLLNLGASDELLAKAKIAFK